MKLFTFTTESNARYYRNRHIRLGWTAFSVFSCKSGWAFWSSFPF
jgi:hypothetical protein